MKIRSLYEFENALDEQFSWRKRELTSIGVSLKHARDHQTKVFFRSGMLLLYAHWEGIIRFSAECFLEYINRQGHHFNQLKPCFLFYAVKETVDTSAKINLANYAAFEKIASLISNPPALKFSINPKTYIATKENQNITSTEFKSIVKKLGLEYLPEYELREKLIDDKLLYYRNPIAHGERSHEEVDDFESTFTLLYDRLFLGTLQTFRSQMADSIKNGHYLAQAS